MFKQSGTAIYITIILLAFSTSCKQPKKQNTSTGKSELYDYFIEKSKANLSIYKYDTALLFTDSALFVAKERNDKVQIANALRLKGVALRNSGNFDAAKSAFFQAWSINSRTGEINMLALTELSISSYYLRLGQNDSAIYFGKSSIQRYEEINDSAGIAMSLNSMGAMLKQLDRRDEALQFFYRAEDIYSLMGDKQRQAYVLNNIGTIYQFFKEYDKALELYEKCKRVSEKAGNHRMIMTSSMNIAGTYYFSDQTKAAEKAYLEALELNKKAPNIETQAAIYISLGAIYAELNEQELCFEYITKALEIAKQTKNLETETHAYYKLAHYYLRKQKKNTAEKYFIKTITVAQKIGDIDHLSHSYKYLSSIQEERGDYRNALSNYKLSRKLNDSIINEKRLEIIFDMESRYEKKKDEAEILYLSNENAKQEIRNSDLKIELVSVFSIIILLIGIIFMIRLKNRKDKIIATQRIQQLEEEQKLLAAQSIIIGQENERKRIAQELHDGIGVLLSTASMHFSNVEERSADEKTVQLLSKANEILKQAGGEVRKISHDMMPGVLAKFGLEEALEDIFENVEDTGNIEVDCQIEAMDKNLEENTEILLYRIVQEILNNTLKHAHAGHIGFSMKKEGDQLIIHYKDDGDGFDPSKIKNDKSLGLSGIKSRIDFLKGKMKLTSNPGKGVHYEIRVPVG